GAFYRLRDVKASQARHQVPFQRQFRAASRTGDTQGAARSAQQFAAAGNLRGQDLPPEVQSGQSPILIQTAARSVTYRDAKRAPIPRGGQVPAPAVPDPQGSGTSSHDYS